MYLSRAVHSEGIHPLTSAVIFVPAVGQLAPHASRCADHCKARGYDIVGVVTGDWPAVLSMLRNGTAAVCVVSRRDHLAPTAEPRIEIARATPHPAGERKSSRYLRPRRMR